MKPEVGRIDCAACGYGEGLLAIGVRNGFGATEAEVAARLEAELLGARANGNGVHAEPAASGGSGPTVGGPAWPWFPKTAAALGWSIVRARDGRTALRVPTHLSNGDEGRMKLRIEKADGRPTAEFAASDDRTIGLINGRALLDAVAGSAHPTVAVCAGESDVLAWAWAAKREGIEVIAVSHATGEASRFPADLARLFAECHAIVAYDADDAGRREGPRRAAELLEAGAASSVAIEVPRGKDVCDFVRAGGTVRELLRLADAARAGGGRAGTVGDDPVPFSTHEVPAFPTDALPAPFREWVAAVADTAQVPSDLPGMLVLATLATCCARTAEFEGAPDWREPLNLFVLVAMEPGARKSAVFAHAVRPLLAFERDERERTAEERSLANSRHAAARKRVERAERGLAEAQDAESRSAADCELSASLAALRDTPAAPELRLVTDDATPERLASLLAEQGGRIAVLSAEAAFIGIIAGRYAKNSAPNLDVALKGHAGDPLVKDRVNCDTVRVEHPALTLALAVQAEVIRELVAINGAVGRGLPQRFLFVVPPSRAGRREIRDDAVPVEIRAAFEVAVLRLLARPVVDPERNPVVLRLDEAAKRVFRGFRVEVERRIGEEGGSKVLAEWLSKLPGAVGRIAALLHLAAAAGRGADPADLIGEDTIERAIRVAEYLVPHARAAFSVAGADASTENAKLLLRWIERHPSGRFTERDLLNGVRCLSIRTMTDVRPALRLLEERNYVDAAPEVPTTSSKGGRPRSPTWVRSARAGAQPAERAEADDAPRRPGSARSAEQPQSEADAMGADRRDEMPPSESGTQSKVRSDTEDT